MQDASVKFYSFPSYVNTASGQPQRIFGFINAQISFNGQSRRLKLYIVPSLEQQLYLGIDFWNLFGITPNISTLSSESVNEINHASFHELSFEDNVKLEEIKNQFPSFAQLGLGKTKLVTHVIDIGTAKPIKQRHYAISPAVQSRIYTELDRMLSLGVIEESQSAWCSPITLVSKANGKNRLCLDARELNKVTVKDAYPLPLIDGLLGRLDQTKFISSIDLKDAFWQIPLDPQSRDKTAFTVPGRPLYQFTVMPFGLCNAPQTMCRLMHRVIPHKLHDRIFVYLDDLLVTSATLEEHFALLREVATRLHQSGLTINVEKSRFLQKEVKYLGYVVGSGGLKTDTDKVKAISEFPIPKTVKQVRSFMGMCGWYRRFIKNFATIAAPLTDLTKKGTKIIWTSTADNAFKCLKTALISAPVLANPDFQKPFYIQCDASTVGVGSVLFQLDANGEEHPIAFVSQKLNTAQKNYSVTELECYAAVLSVKKFRPYVEGYSFTLYTDHASLRWLMSQKDLSGRLARWSLKLQAFNFTIGYRKGSLNVVPDTLSRAFSEERAADSSIPLTGQIDALTHSELNADLKKMRPLQIDLHHPAFKSEEYHQLVKTVQETEPNTNFCIKEGKVLHTSSFGLRYTDTDLPEWRLVVPKDLTGSLIQQAHTPPSSAHMGASKTLERLQRQFFWNRMALDVREFVANCASCKMNKSTNYCTKPKMGHPYTSERPFQKIYIDLLGPYPRSKRGNTHICIVLDHYSKFVLLKPLREATSSLICNYLENEVFLLFSVPEFVISDNGKQFTSKMFEAILNKYGVGHIRTPIYSPQSNASERVNRTVLAAIRNYLTDTTHNEWDLYLQEVAAALRNVVHSTTKFAPHYLAFGQHMILHGSDYELWRLLSDSGNNDVAIFPKSDRLNLVREKIKHYIIAAHNKTAKYYNLRSNSRELVPGQAVFVRSFAQSDAANKFTYKLSPKFLPGIVKSKVGTVAYEVWNDEGKKLGIYHLKDIRT